LLILALASAAAAPDTRPASRPAAVPPELIFPDNNESPRTTIGTNTDLTGDSLTLAPTVLINTPPEPSVTCRIDRRLTSVFRYDGPAREGRTSDGKPIRVVYGSRGSVKDLRVGQRLRLTTQDGVARAVNVMSTPATRPATVPSTGPASRPAAAAAGELPPQEIDRRLAEVRRRIPFMLARDDRGTVVALAMEVGGDADNLLRRIPVLTGVVEADLSWSPLSEDGVERLVRKLPNIERLDIRGYNAWSADEAGPLSAAAHLKFVVVRVKRDEVEQWRRLLGDRVNLGDNGAAGSPAGQWVWRDRLGW
jgi:hypothetical protein